MIKIVALNESESEEENADESVATNEAQETIAENEYLRALGYKAKGRSDLALSLMLELLETRVLNEVCMESKNEKLITIRYNCHKNIALTYEEKQEYQKALHHFTLAMELDDTDVYTMHRLGQLALRMRSLDLADYAFEKCLKRNPNHWSAADGILQILCLNANIMGAYGWALTWYLRDNKYERALNVLTEITENFADIIPFYETIWNTPFVKPPGYTCKGKKSVFPEPIDMPEVDTKMPKPDIEQFRVKHLNWLSIGKYIITVYNHLLETKQSILFVLSVDDFLEQSREDDNEKSPSEMDIIPDTGSECNENSNEPSSNSNQSSASNNQVEENVGSANDDGIFIAPSTDNIGSRTPQQSNDSNAEDSDSNVKVDNEANKPKPRRRCSDLSFLEQWGWHKNRRHSSRKKSQQERQETDTTLNGFLKRIFARFTEENFDNESPFKSTQCDFRYAESEGSYDRPSEVQQQDVKEFLEQTRDDFNAFLESLKSKPFDLILLIFKWLKCMSKYWSQHVGEDLKESYHNIFTLYMEHYDLNNWNQLSNDNFNASFRMVLFFMEIDLEKTVKADKEIDAMWQRLFIHLTFNSGCAYVIADDLYERNIIRLIHLEYALAKYENRLNKCVESLYHLEELIEAQKIDFCLELPNMTKFNYLDLALVRKNRVETQRKIGLNKVRDLYEAKQWHQLVKILKDSLAHTKEKSNESWTRDLQTQFEVLLESIWKTGDFEDCLIWTEKCLHYSSSKYLAEPNDTPNQKRWAESVNFMFIYLEALLLREGYQILDALDNYISRLVQNIVKLLVHQLDAPFDKNNNPVHVLEIKRPWVVLHQVLLREENSIPIIIKVRSTDATLDNEEIEDLLPHSFLILFTAHEFLGKRFWCTRDNGQLLLYTIEMVSPNLRAPLYDAIRDIIMEYIEQTTYCLYGYPPKKARSRHIEEHDATSVDLTWTRAMQLFDLYRPENLPEINSYKLESISADMEQLLVKIVQLIPKEIDPSEVISKIQDFISGDSDSVPESCVFLPYKISCIYYLLADYYFKSRDFSKTIKYYTLDLACHPGRFDSWAGIALSKASKIETKLNGIQSIDAKSFLSECEEAVRCFKQCTELNHEQVLVWIEYGSFAYTLHSFCSRDLKHSSDMLSLEQFTFVEERKENFLSIAYECFLKADVMLQKQSEEGTFEETESHDEKWLNQYMLGKIGEKRKDSPSVYMNHYLTAANFLYENNATYPIKINHSNPTTLSVEALEIFYRTNAAIIKFLEQDKVITREVGDLFNQVLKNLANSPFAFNKAKIDGNCLNAFKRKMADKAESNAAKQAKTDESSPAPAVSPLGQEVIERPQKGLTPPAGGHDIEPLTKQTLNLPDMKGNTADDSKPTSPSRRGSQESSATNTTSTATGTTSSTSSTSSSDSSSSDSDSSDSDSSDTDDDKKRDKNAPYSEHELEPIYRTCVRNLEECVTRFPEHYKSVYRLVYHYMHAPDRLKDLEKCRQLLLGQYTTNLGNQISGLFSDRKNNNIFNGIWRIPSSEIDRPGSFSSHLVKCVALLIRVLQKSNNHKLLVDVALQLYRTPDIDKRYIKDSERLELYQQAMTFCVQIIRNILKQITEIRDNVETLNLLIDVYKAHKKCIKHMNQKEPQFTQLLVDVYKCYIQDKVAKLPENLNLLDLAIKLCLQEIASRKNQEKQALSGGIAGNTNSNPSSGNEPLPPGLKPATSTTSTSATTSKPPQIPGITSRGRNRQASTKPATSSNVQSTQQTNQTASAPSSSTTSTSSIFSQPSFLALMSLYTNPMMGNQMTKEHVEFQKLFGEYFKLLEGGTSKTGANVGPNLASPSMSSLLNSTAAAPSTKSSMPVTSVSESSSITSSTPKVPQFDIKNLIASAASQVSKISTSSQSHSTTINIGGGELTITPTSSKAVHKDSSTASTRLTSSLASSSSSISVTKVPSHSPNIYIKPLSELTHKPPAAPVLPDLPKSLSITPSTSIFSQEKSRMSNPPLHQNTAEKSQLKSKSSMKKKPSAGTPYTRPLPARAQSSSAPPLSTLSASEMAVLAGLNQQYPMANDFSIDNYKNQAALLATYAELFKSTSVMSQIAQISQLQQFQMLGQKRTYTKRSRNPKPKKTPELPASVDSALKSLSPQITMIPSTSKGSSKPSQFNMASYNAPATITSVGPAISISGPPTGSKLSPKPIATPPPVGSGLSQTSPMKTLQQKLAERQKANQLNENKSLGSATSSGKRASNDVIILD